MITVGEMMTAIPEPVTCLKCNKSMKAIGHVWCYRCRSNQSQSAHLTPNRQCGYSTQPREINKAEIQRAVVDFYAAEMAAGRGIDYIRGVYIRTLTMERARNVHKTAETPRNTDFDYDEGCSWHLREQPQGPSSLDHEGNFGDQTQGSLPPDQTHLRGLDRGIFGESRCG